MGLIPDCCINEKRERKIVKRSTLKRKHTRPSRISNELHSGDENEQDMTVAALIHHDETRSPMVIQATYPGTDNIQSPPSKRSKLEVRPPLTGGNEQ